MSSRHTDHASVGSAPTIRRLFLEEVDIAAARRLLSLLTVAEPDGADALLSGGGDAVEQARAQLALIGRRVEILGRRFRAEPPFVLLLALYATAPQEPAITKTRLGQLSGMKWTTLERWVQVLNGEGWLTMSKADEWDQRKVYVSLTTKARQKLEELFT